MTPFDNYGVYSLDMKSLSIGQLAHAAGINPESVWFYEAQSLLPEPPRSMAGYRMYTQDSVLRIRFIKRAQDRLLPKGDQRAAPPSSSSTDAGSFACPWQSCSKLDHHQPQRFG
jgi:hypothetical protein